MPPTHKHLVGYISIPTRPCLVVNSRRSTVEYHLEVVGKTGVEKWCRIPNDLYADLCRLKIDNPYVCQRAPKKWATYRYRLERFARRYPDLTTRDLKPYHVQEWLDSLDELASGSKRNHARAIKRCMRWAEKQGYIDRSPIDHLELPKGGTREVVLSQDEFDRLLSLVPDAGFRDLLIATWATGCRPQESLRVEKRHVDLVNCRWVLPPSEAKGEEFPRIVYLPDRALEITKRLILRYPEGKLFRNSRGNPWTPNSVHFAFGRVQIRLGKLAMKELGIEIDPQDIAQLMREFWPILRVGPGGRLWPVFRLQASGRCCR